MRYIVNGQEMNRKTLVQKVLEVVKDLPTEKQPPMAKRELYPIEYNVKNHAYGIARAMGWDIVPIPRDTITLEYNGLQGNAEIKWIETNQWGVGHYAVFISVPYQNSCWENLFVFNPNDGQLAMKKAEERLRSALMRCTLC